MAKPFPKQSTTFIIYCIFKRKRWAPSTMANIMDLLGDGMKTVRKNNNISLLYVLYQVRFFNHTDLRAELNYSKSITNSLF